MSLVAWFPLSNSVTNLGEANLTMGSPLSSTTTFNRANAKTAEYCYYNSSYSNGGYVSNEQISLGDKQSMACWVRFSELMSGANLGGSLCGQHRYSSNTGMGLTIKYVTADTGYLSVNTGTGTSRTYNTYCGSTLLTKNTWYHVAYTYNGITSTLRLYVNGQPDGVFNVSNLLNPKDYFMIGCWSFNSTTGNAVYGGYKLNGFLQDVRAYDYVLSQEEIKNLSKGLMCHYNFENLYESIQAVQFTGAQYIDSEVRSLNYKNFEITIDFRRSDMLTEDSCLFGQRQFGKYTNIYNGYYESAYGNTAAGTANNLNRHTIIMNESGLFVDGTSLLGGPAPQISSNFSALIGAFTEDVPSNAKWFFKGYIYSLKIESDNEVVRDYIPVINTLNGDVGLYDRVKNKFYGSATATALKSYGWNNVVGAKINVYDGNNYFVKDISGNNYHCKALNCTATQVASDVRIGTTSLSFNGNAYLKNQNFRMSPIFSISTWVKTSSTQTQCLFCCRGQTGTGPALFLINGYSGIIRFDTNNTSCQANYAKDTDWHHIVCTFDGSTRKIYLDGVLKTTTSNSSSGISYSVMSIGASYSGSSSPTPNGNFLNGRLADWRLYSTVLTQEDVLDLWNNRGTLDRNGNFYCDGVSTKYHTSHLTSDVIIKSNEFELSKKGLLSTNYDEVPIISGYDQELVDGKYLYRRFVNSDLPSPGFGNLPWLLIDTGVKFNYNTNDAVEFSVIPQRTNQFYPAFCIGCQSTSYTKALVFEYGYDSSVSYHWKVHLDDRSGGQTLYTSTDGIFTRKTFKWENQQLFVDGELVYTVSGTITTLDPQQNIIINGGYKIENSQYVLVNGIDGDFLYCKIWKNGVLVRDYVPVLTENIFPVQTGLYDLIDKNFKTSYTNLTYEFKEITMFPLVYSDGGAAVAKYELANKYALNRIIANRLTGVQRLTVYYMDAQGYAQTLSTVTNPINSADCPMNSYYEWTATPASGYTMSQTSGSGYVGGQVTIAPTATQNTQLADPYFEYGYTDRFDNQYDIGVYVENPSTNPTVTCGIQLTLWTSTQEDYNYYLDLTLNPGSSYFGVILENKYPLDGHSDFESYEIECDFSATGYTGSSAYDSDSVGNMPQMTR